MLPYNGWVIFSRHLRCPTSFHKVGLDNNKMFNSHGSGDKGNKITNMYKFLNYKFHNILKYYIDTMSQYTGA